MRYFILIGTLVFTSSLFAVGNEGTSTNSTAPTLSTIESMPNNVLSNIFSFLPSAECDEACFVSKRFKQVGKESLREHQIHRVSMSQFMAKSAKYANKYAGLIVDVFPDDPVIDVTKSLNLKRIEALKLTKDENAGLKGIKYLEAPVKDYVSLKALIHVVPNTARLSVVLDEPVTERNIQQWIDDVETTELRQLDAISLTVDRADTALTLLNLLATRLDYANVNPGDYYPRIVMFVDQCLSNVHVAVKKTFPDRSVVEETEEVHSNLNDEQEKQLKKLVQIFGSHLDLYSNSDVLTCVQRSYTVTNEPVTGHYQGRPAPQSLGYIRAHMVPVLKELFAEHKVSDRDLKETPFFTENLYTHLIFMPTTIERVSRIWTGLSVIPRRLIDISGITFDAEGFHKLCLANPKQLDHVQYCTKIVKQIQLLSEEKQKAILSLNNCFFEADSLESYSNLTNILMQLPDNDPIWQDWEKIQLLLECRKLGYLPCHQPMDQSFKQILLLLPLIKASYEEINFSNLKIHYEEYSSDQLHQSRFLFDTAELNAFTGLLRHPLPNTTLEELGKGVEKILQLISDKDKKKRWLYLMVVRKIDYYSPPESGVSYDINNIVRIYERLVALDDAQLAKLKRAFFEDCNLFLTSRLSATPEQIFERELATALAE